jgi:antitoxin component YwqK of YwqJK toxin-antitoxin module
MNNRQLFLPTLILLLSLAFGNSSFAQAQISSDQYDTYINDTLLIDPSEIPKIQTLDVEVQKTMTFKPKTDGYKTYYYVTGKKYSSGIVKDKKPDGAWTSWYENGQVNKKLIFKDGKKEGAYESWYENGKKNAEGQYKNDLREGDWIFYKDDGSLMGNYKYKDGELVK